MIPLVGCSSLLGIVDPSTGTRIDGGVDAVDAPAGDHLLFNVGDFQLAQLQNAQLHVMFVHRDGTMEDVTSTATYSSDNDLLATVSTSGVITSGSQSGNVTITAMLAGAAPAMVRASIKTTLCHPVINELQTASSASPADEWVEIYNPCTMTMSVDGWTLNYRGANVVAAMPDSTFMIMLAGDMMPGDIRLYVGLGYVGPNDGVFANTNPNGLMGVASGAVGLRMGAMSVGMIVDSVGYGSVASGNPFLESTAAPAMAANVSASRLPFDGKDDNDGINDFKTTTTPTPRALNAR